MSDRIWRALSMYALPTLIMIAMATIVAFSGVTGPPERAFAFLATLLALGVAGYGGVWLLLRTVRHATRGDG